MERVYKYQGLGNDFVVLDRRGSGRDIDAAASRRLCDRRLGVGADGVLALLPSKLAVARMVVHNADGSVAEMCGNGIRCAVKYLVDHGGEKPPRLAVETGAGVLWCEVSYAGGEARSVQVSMGPARLEAPNLPPGGPFVARELPGAFGLRGTAVNLGNPHLVFLDADPERAGELGPSLERSPLFAERTNVELCRLGPDGLTVAVWERGVGLTQACGTGACAAAVAAAVQKRAPFGTWLKVTLPGGPLEVRVAEDLSSVELRGPAEFVFEAVVPWLDTP
ncbi:MAG: diaminopimelate epimerase [Myxococcaceae bacterium]